MLRYLRSIIKAGFNGHGALG